MLCSSKNLAAVRNNSVRNGMGSRWIGFILKLAMIVIVEKIDSANLYKHWIATFL